jgi:aryl carrier-like protein
MKTLEEYKKEFDDIKLEVSFLIEKVGLKFTVEEFLQIDSITFNDLPNLSTADAKELKKDYLILGNETYEVFNEETFKYDKFKTRTLIFSLRQSKIIKLKEEQLFKTILDYVKLISFYEKYKLLKKELENQLYIENPEVATWWKLTPFIGIVEGMKKINEITTNSFWELYNFKLKMEEEDRLVYLKRSEYLYNKLKKKED